MSYRSRFLLKSLAVILGLWGVVGIIVKVAGSMKPTPEKIIRYVERNPLDEIDDEGRRKEVIGQIADMMNQLDPEDLRDFEESGDRETRRAMFSSMSEEEQWFFMERRMGRAFTQMMELFNGMERAERKEMVERALRQMRQGESSRSQGGGSGMPLEDGDPEMVEKVATAGMEAYFRDASAETKMDLAPLMEEIQKIMSAPGRGPRRR